jgi:hypothetical protein
VQAIAVHRRRQPAAVGPKQLGASGVLYILDLRHRIKVDSVVAGDANQFDRVFFTIAAGTFVAIAMWFLQFCALFFISVRLCSVLRHCGAVLPIATGCLVCLGVTALFVVGLLATSSIPSALPPPGATPSAASPASATAVGWPSAWAKSAADRGAPLDTRGGAFLAKSHL